MADDMDYESKPKIKQFFNEIADKELTNENYKKIYDRVMSNDNIIGAQIENIHYSLKMNNQSYKSYIESKDFKDAFEENIVPVEVYRLLVERVKMMSEVYSWKWLECEIHKRVSGKLKELHDETDAMEIRSEAMKEMKAMVDRSNQVFLEEHKLNSQSFRNFMETLMSRQDIATSKIVNNQEYVLQKILSIIPDFLARMFPEKTETIEKMRNTFDDTIGEMGIDNYRHSSQPESQSESQEQPKKDSLDDPDRYVDEQKKSFQNVKREDNTREKSFQNVKREDNTREKSFQNVKREDDSRREKSSLDHLKESDYPEKEEQKFKKKGPGRPPKNKDSEEDKQSINEDIFDDFEDNDSSPLAR